MIMQGSCQSCQVRPGMSERPNKTVVASIEPIWCANGRLKTCRQSGTLAQKILQSEELMSPAIVCRSLRKTYPSKPPVDAVNGLDLQIERGECFGLLGPNGAGKTTTIEILEGLLDATDGEVEILGEHWGGADDRALRQRIGVSLQETKLTEK